jgi:hypothetical protein
MEEDSSGTRSVRLPTFDGKFKSFMIWWICFRAFVTVHKFVEALKAEDEAHLPAREDAVLVETVAAA